MKRLIFLMSIVALLFTTSCIKGPVVGGKSSTDYIGKLVVADDTTGEVTYTDNEAKLTLTIPNVVEPKMDIIFSGVKFAELMPIKLNLAMLGVPFKTTVSEDQTTINYIFDQENIIPEGFDEQYLINRVWGVVSRRIEISFKMINAKRNSKVTFVYDSGASDVE